MIYSVKIINQIATNVTISHSFEQVVDDTEEATEFGATCARLMNAYNIGFGEADLDNDDR